MSYYSKSFKIEVAEEALKPEFEHAFHIVARKYGLRPSTVRNWRNIYRDHGPDGFSKSFKAQERYKTLSLKDKEIAELKEEIEILKKAAAFLAKVNRE